MVDGFTFEQGDYTYTFNKNSKFFRVKVTDNSKTSYEDMPDEVTYDNETYPVVYGKACFSGCTNMVTSPKLSANLRSVNGCFYGCASLAEPPQIPSSVTDMHQCFLGCSSLVSPPNIPSSVKYMSFCFQDCSALKTPPEIPNIVADLMQTFLRCSSLETAPTIPDSVTNMQSTFARCSALKNAPEFPNSLENAYATYSGCTSLINVPNLPDSVTDMRFCFSGCSSLESAPQLPANIKSLYASFSSCASLKTPPTIPDTVEDMTRTFNMCEMLDTPPQLPTSLVSMEQCFERCTALKEAPAIPNSVVNMRRAFEGCSALLLAPQIPEGVTDMERCFYSCKSMKAPFPNIPSTVDNISLAFQSCYAIGGNIFVAGTPSKAVDVFGYIENDVFIIDSNNSSEWKSVANKSSHFVHYGLQDANVNADSPEAYRVADATSRVAKLNGSYIYIKQTFTCVEGTYPNGTNVSVSKISATEISPTRALDVEFSTSSVGNKIVCEGWVSFEDFDQHTIQVLPEILFDFSSGQLTKTKSFYNQSPVQVPKAYVLIDAYHDSTTGAEGISFGTFTDTKDAKFLVDLKEYHKQLASFEDGMTIAGNVTLYIDETATEGYDDYYLYAELVKMGLLT